MNFIRKLLKRKWVLALGGLILIGGGYFGYKTIKTKDTAPQYVTSAVQKGTLTVSVSGTGQVSALNQIDIKPKVSGDITFIGVVNSQSVKAGDVIARIDSSDAQKTVRDAQTSLETAQLSLDKLKQPADALTLLQAENSLLQAQEAKQSAEEDLDNSYGDAYNVVVGAFLNLPGIMTDLGETFFKDTIAKYQDNIDWYEAQGTYSNNSDLALYKAKVIQDYDSARNKFDLAQNKYRTLSRNSTNEEIENLLNQTYETTKYISDAIKSGKNYIDFIQDLIIQHGGQVNSVFTTHKTTLNSDTSTANSQISSLGSAITKLTDLKNSITTAERSIAEKTESLANLKSGPDALDLRSQELSVQQKQNTLADAQQKLANYTVRASIDGTIAQVSAKKGDVASSGSSIATLISTQQIVEISLNEVDISKVKVGQKAVLTFDAIEGLTITGTVADMDSIGTATQGVVNYAVKISFDTQDDQVKPGMSVSASIITDIRQDALLIPNSAVKSQGETTYVEILENGKPKSQTVQIGIANDSSTEIISGVNEGQQVVTQIITTNTTTKTNTQTKSQGIGIPGLGGDGPR